MNDISDLLTSADLADATDRMMLADALEDAGRDDEAELLRATSVPARYRMGEIKVDAERLDTFTLCYAETGLRLELDAETGRPLDYAHDIDDIAPLALAQIVTDCAKFSADNADDIGAVSEDAGTIGYLFWLSRNHHGHGFYNYEGDEFERMHRSSKNFPECSLYLGDDGRIHYFAG